MMNAQILFRFWIFKGTKAGQSFYWLSKDLLPLKQAEVNKWAHKIKSSLFACLVLCFFISQSDALASPGSAWRETSISVSTSNRTAEIVVPEGAKRIAVEVLNSKGQWIRWTTRKVSAGKTEISVKIPARAASRTWRAWAEVPSSLKFPAAFYKGKKTFAQAASSGYGEASGTDALKREGDVFFSSAANDSSKTSEQEKTVEADIWKAEGNTVFFFNQLRGLQVIDLSNPAEPSLVCSVRLPAVGQDLYVLPESGGVRHAILLARDPEDWDATVVYLVRIANSKAEITSKKKVSGMLADSRLKGSRLFLATQTWRNWMSVGQDRAVLREVAVDTGSGSLVEGNSFEISGAWPVISAGNDWMAVATSDWSQWNVSKVSLFSISENGLLRLNAEPIRTAGRIYDKFKMQVRDGVFSAFSQGWVNAETGDWAAWGTPVTMLENFSVTGNKLAGLEIIRGEQLFATRFAGDKAYAVTFQQVDPLWVIDLADSSAPAITGHLEVPGWSTYIEPLGDLLFSIGWDEGRVAASLFDVADPSNPTLASRVFLSDSWGGFSESLYDEKALKILSEENLALIPFSVNWSDSGDTGHRIQLLEIDRASKSLIPRGRIVHEFEPRRSAMVDGALASISQRQIVTADISNRDNPSILADLLLAWPVQRVVVAGDYLFQIADGSTWWDASPALRVTTISDPDAILAELPIGSGTVLDAGFRDGQVLILRGEGLRTESPWIKRPRLLAVSSLEGSAKASSNPSLSLDVYTLSDPLAPVLAGSTVVELGSESGNWETSQMMFPSSGTVAVLARQSPMSWWGGWFRPRPIAIDDKMAILPATSRMPYYDSDPASAESSLAAVFQPALLDAKIVELPSDKIVSLDSAKAADGIVVFGFGEKIDGYGSAESKRSHHAGILNLLDPSAPVLSEPVTLPGRLLAVSELDRRGFLVWTEEAQADGERLGLAVSACDMRNAFLINTLSDVGSPEPAIAGRGVFFWGSDQLKGYQLQDSGSFKALGSMSMAFTPDALRIVESDICASTYNRFAATALSSFPATPRVWNAATGVDLKKVFPLPANSYATPAGDYGIEVFK